MRLVPSSPASRNTAESHHTGLKLNISAKAASAPATPPMAAVWVLIFHHALITAHVICTSSAAMSMPPMKRGMCMRSMR